MTLTDNAFAVLGARPADDRMTLNEKADEAALFGGGETEDALNQLMQLNRRLSAELAWFPGASDQAADAFLEYAKALGEGRAAAVPPVEGLGTALAQANGLAALFEIWPVDDPAMLEALCRALDSILGQVTAQEAFEAVNQDRRRGGWEPVPDVMSLVEPLNGRLRELCAPVRKVAERMERKALAGAILKLLAPAGFDAQGSVAQALLDSYAMRVHEQAEAGKQRLMERIGQLSKADSVSKAQLSEMADLVNEWCDLTAPLRKIPGSYRDDARAIGFGMREVVVNYVNKAGSVKKKQVYTFRVLNGTRTVTLEYQSQLPYVQEARDRTFWLKSRFFEQVELVSRLEEDVKMLNQIEENEKTMLSNAEERARMQAGPFAKRI